jgi:hypothetical protein
MLKKFIMFTCVVISLYAFSTKVIAEPTEIVPVVKQLSIPELIQVYSIQYNVSPTDMTKVIKCESNFNPNAFHKDDGGVGKHSVGLLQFQKTTFDLWSARLGEELDYYSYNDQIKLGAYMFSKGQIGQWTCGRMLK